MGSFTTLYGEPVMPWHGQNGARRIWAADGLQLVADFTPEHRASMMVRISVGRPAGASAALKVPALPHP